MAETLFAGISGLELPEPEWMGRVVEEERESLAELSEARGRLSLLTRQGRRAELLDTVDLDGEVSRGGRGGAACVAVAIRAGRLTVANVGDCRAVLLREGGLSGFEMHQLNSLHTGDNPEEEQLVLQRGGTFLSRKGTKRLQGELTLTRCFGDSRLKRYLSCQPEVLHVPLDSSARFLVLGSDGLWNHLLLEEAAQVLKTGRAQGRPRTRTALLHPAEGSDPP
ncbi:unnamed protein product [Arctogadus glacialis]